MNRPEILALAHVSLLVRDLDRARVFYEDLLGLQANPARPELGFPGIWYRIGAAEIHLLCLPNPDPVVGRPEHGGRDRHVAFQVNDLAPFRARLDAAGLPYSLSRSGRAALFCRDPEGNAVELIGPTFQVPDDYLVLR